MNLRRRLAAACLLSVSSLSPAGCSTISEFTPPDWAWFDVVGHPTGGIPATLGYYAGVAAWTPAGFVLGGLLPYPADEAVGKVPGEVLGTGVGVVLGAPFHLLALPFEGGGEEEAPAPR